MKKLLLSIAVITAIGIGFSGCASTGYITSKHNGKLYYVPENSQRFQYFNSNVDELHCYHNGQKTGRILYPADSQQVQNYQYQEKKNQEGWDNLNNQLHRSSESMRKMTESMTPKRYNVYHYNGY